MATTPSQAVFTEEVQASTIGDQVPVPPVGSLALFSNQNDIWYAKNHAGTVTALAGVTSVTNADGTIVITGSGTVPIVSRAAITGDVAINAASNTSTLAAIITAGGPTGSASVVPVITYDAKGRLTAVSTATITPSAIGAVAGVTAADGSITMGGTATNPTVSRSALTGDITASAGLNATVLKNTGPGATGPIGDASHVATVTIDAQGRTTALSSTLITPAAIGAPSGSGTSSGANTGDVTLTAVGSSPNANAAALAGQALTLEPASAAFPGLLSAANFTKLAGYYDAVADFGFVGDHRVCAEITAGAAVTQVMTAGSNVVTLTVTAPFTSTAVDGGKRITIGGAGTAGAPLVGFINTVSSSSSCTIVTTKGGGTPQNAVISVAANSSFYIMVQFGTDNSAAMTTMASTLNALAFGTPKVVFPMTATNRFASSTGITLNKTVAFEGMGGGYSTDVGDYTKAGGTCLAWWGTNNGPATFDGFIKIVPITGATAFPINAPSFRHMWIDCRNGDQNQALIGLQLYDCDGFDVQDFFVMDALAMGIDFGVVEPLGVTASVSRGEMHNNRVRMLESNIISYFTCTTNNTTAITSVVPNFTAADVGKVVVGPGVPAGTTLSAQAGASGTLSQATTGGGLSGTTLTFLENPTPTTTTTAITLTASGQSLTLAAINGLTPSGYAWVQTSIGTPFLINYTGGGGTTTLTGCTVAAADVPYLPTTVSGSNVVQAFPGNGTCAKFSGSTTANANLANFQMWQLSHGSTWGPAAVDCRNIDTQTFLQIVVNGGSNTNDGAINRIRKPGFRFSGHNTLVSLISRNVVCINCEPGAGGMSAMALLNTGAKLGFPSQGNYADFYQLANGSPIPINEGGFAGFYWNPNGGVRSGIDNPPTAAAAQAIVATTALITGSQVVMPPQGFQVGTVIRWKLAITCTTGAAVATTYGVRVGANGTTADAPIAVQSYTGSAVNGGVNVLAVEWRINSIGASAGSQAVFILGQNANTNTGLSTTIHPINIVAGTAFSTVTSGLLYAELVAVTGAGVTHTINSCTAEIVKAGNP